MASFNSTDFNKDTTIEKLEDYLAALKVRKDEAVKLGNFESAASIRDEEKRILDIVNQKNEATR